MFQNLVVKVHEDTITLQVNAYSLAHNKPRNAYGSKYTISYILCQSTLKKKIKKLTAEHVRQMGHYKKGESHFKKL